MSSIEEQKTVISLVDANEDTMNKYCFLWNQTAISIEQVVINATVIALCVFSEIRCHPTAVIYQFQIIFYISWFKALPSFGEPILQTNNQEL